MANVTLPSFVMARSLNYLLHRRHGQTKSIRETLTLSHEVQNGVSFAIETLRSLDTTRSYSHPRPDGLCLKDCMHNQCLISLS